jgi:hypothetical protein
MNPTQEQTTTAPAEVTPADILRGAATYLDRYGWHQGDYYATIADPSVPFPPACAFGAIAAAAYGGRIADPYSPNLPGDQRRAFTRAADVFDGYLIDYHGTDDGNLIPGQEWNDVTGRTAADVTAALRAAAHKWDRVNGGAR